MAGLRLIALKNIAKPISSTLTLAIAGIAFISTRSQTLSKSAIQERQNKRSSHLIDIPKVNWPIPEFLFLEQC